MKDLVRVERIVSELSNAIGVAVLLTNDSAYRKEPRSLDSVDAAFRLHEGRSLTGTLAWADRVDGTARGREAALELRGTYRMEWRDYSRVPAPRSPQFRYLLLSATAD